MTTIHRTLLIGLGGTGIDVLRRFKTYHVKTTTPENRQHIRLLGIDTVFQTAEKSRQDADQDQAGDYLEPLADSEFVQLARTSISNLTIKQKAHLPRFKEAAKNLPAFLVQDGAGQKRLAGYLAYLWDGQRIVSSLESALKDLYSDEVNARFSSDRMGQRTRVFIVSSVCGGTGTGMFLDVSYLLRSLFDEKNFEARFFGVLFLPSAFPQLMKNRSVARNVRANGMAALEELNYYMQETHPENTWLPAPTDRPMPTTGQVFNRCFIVGGQTEVGSLVNDTERLYEKTANFLFSCIAFPRILDDIVEFFATNPAGNYAGIGSFALPLPQSKFTEKYTTLMGREILADLFSTEIGDPVSVDDFLARTRFAESESTERSPLMTEAQTRLDQEVFGFGQPSDQEKAQLQMHQMQEQAQRVLNELRPRVAEQARAIMQDVVLKVRSGTGLPELVTKGVLAARLELLRSLMQRLSGIAAKATAFQQESLAEILAAAQKKPGFFEKSSPESRIARYKTTLAGAFMDEVRTMLQGELASQAERTRGDLLPYADELSSLLAKAAATQDAFDGDSERFLAERRKASDVGQALAQTTMGRNVEIDDRYRENRMGMLQVCRAELKVSDVVRGDKVQMESFVRKVHAIAQDWVKDKVTISQALDSDGFARGLNSAWVSLQLIPWPDSIVTTSNNIFYPGDEEVKEQVARRLQQWPGAQESEPKYIPMDASVVTLIRMRHGFKLGDVQELDEMAQAYKEVIDDPQLGPFLKIPTHRREVLRYENLAGEQARLFALALALGVLKEFGLNYKLNGSPLLANDVENKVERRKLAYKRLLSSENRTIVEHARDTKLNELGNGKVASLLRAEAQERYAQPSGDAEYQELLTIEQRNLLEYAEALG